MVLLKEEWRNLEFIGYHNYEVSNFGRVRSLKYGLMSDNRISKHGYRRVRFSHNGKRKEIPVHRLVALAFVDNPNKEEWNVVNHKDENKLNNRYDNLEWCTNEYNLTYGTLVQRRVATRYRNDTWNCDELKEINRKPVFKYDFNGNLIKKFISLTECYNEDKVTSKILLSDTPMRRGSVYSYRDDITVEDILHMVEIVKKSYNGKMIKAYQYDYDCNLVAIHDDINKLGCDIPAIKLCLEGKKKFYNKYIWSKVELDENILRYMANDIMDYKEIYAYDINTLELKKYDNIDQIEDGINRNIVRNCCNGVNLTYLGYIWSYKELKDNELSNIKRRHFQLDIKKKVYVYDYEYNEKIYGSVQSCINDGFCKSKIHKCLKGEALSYNGYIFSYEELRNCDIDSIVDEISITCKIKPVHQYDREFNLIKIWKSPQQTKIHGFVPIYVSECCKGERNSYRDYIWRYRKIK